MIFSGRNFKPKGKWIKEGLGVFRKFSISLFNFSQAVVSIELAKKFIQVCYLRGRPK